MVTRKERREKVSKVKICEQKNVPKSVTGKAKSDDAIRTAQINSV